MAVLRYNLKANHTPMETLDAVLRYNFESESQPALILLSYCSAVLRYNLKANHNTTYF